MLLDDIANVELFNAGLGERRKTLPLLTIDPDGSASGGASRLISGNSPPKGHTEMAPIIVVEVLTDSAQPSSNWITEIIVHLGYRHQGFVDGNAVFFPE